MVSYVLNAINTLTGIICAYYAYKTYQNDHKDR